MTNTSGGDEFKEVRYNMPMTKATEQQLEAEVIATFREQLPFSWDDDLLKEVMAIVRKAWVLGIETGYREARDARNG